MEFNNKLYNLRKQKGLSQEELANRLNVSRQTISKWEVGDSTPDMENLIAISSLFEISLDELVLDKPTVPDEAAPKKAIHLSEDGKKKTKKIVTIIAIAAGVIVLIDVVSMIVFFCLKGFPQ